MTPRPNTRVLPPTPTLTSWWTRPMTRERFTEVAAERAKELNAVTQNYAQPVKMGDE